jgi:hypothetical protein
MNRFSIWSQLRPFVLALLFGIAPPTAWGQPVILLFCSLTFPSLSQFAIRFDCLSNGYSERQRLTPPSFGWR